MTFQFTDGSFELGYDGQPWGRRTSTDQRYYHLAKPVRRPVRPFRSEAILAAQEIRASRPGRIIIPYSGGADSEGICEAFRRAKVEFTPLVVVYEHELNRHDVDYAFAWCRRHGYEPIVEHIDLDKFYASGMALELARMCQAWELAYMPVLSVMLEYRSQGFFIGPGEASIHRVLRENGRSEWLYSESERHYCYNKFMAAANINGVPSFYQWSTELVHSVLCDPLLEALASGLYAARIWGSSILKHSLYRKHLGLQPRIKFTGFEASGSMLSLHNHAWRQDPASMLCMNQSSDIEYWSQVDNARWRPA
ncbi:hypothetical protein SAMN05192549_105174 [Duganella sacchari]|uniref:Asparagine synthase n=1 Tax=Duganella sacchari TaxID=551987 RepID=A0A1M7PKJ8_9BURK|nr:hypothetical protein [Duganella sacchari]SHN17748.1 hypothetical protein SAMN05192549_105174 [Duganella sacchari]